MIRACSRLSFAKGLSYVRRSFKELCGAALVGSGGWSTLGPTTRQLGFEEALGPSVPSTSDARPLGDNGAYLWGYVGPRTGCLNQKWISSCTVFNNCTRLCAIKTVCTRLCAHIYMHTFMCTRLCAHVMCTRLCAHVMYTRLCAHVMCTRL